MFKLLSRRLRSCYAALGLWGIAACADGSTIELVPEHSTTPGLVADESLLGQAYAGPAGAVVGYLQGSVKRLCGGTLIAPHLVLTAAQCVVDTNGKPVALNPWQYKFTQRFKASLHHVGAGTAISKIVVHPEFNLGRGENKLPSRASELYQALEQRCGATYQDGLVGLLRWLLRRPSAAMLQREHAWQQCAERTGLLQELIVVAQAMRHDLAVLVLEHPVTTVAPATLLGPRRDGCALKGLSVSLTSYGASAQMGSANERTSLRMSGRARVTSAQQDALVLTGDGTLFAPDDAGAGLFDDSGAEAVIVGLLKGTPTLPRSGRYTAMALATPICMYEPWLRQEIQRTHP